MELYHRRQVHYFYLGYTSSRNKGHFHAMGKYILILRNQLYDTDGRVWEGDNTSPQAELIRTVTHWSEIVSPEDNPPVHYSPAEVEECLDRDTKHKNDDQMQQVLDFIGINIEGWVSNWEFLKRRRRLNLSKTSWRKTLIQKKRGGSLMSSGPFRIAKE